MNSAICTLKFLKDDTIQGMWQCGCLVNTAACVAVTLASQFKNPNIVVFWPTHTAAVATSCVWWLMQYC